jgi:hypothetical protein
MNRSICYFLAAAFHIAAAATFCPASFEPYCFSPALATFSNPLPFLPISLPAWIFLDIADFSFLVKPDEGFFLLLLF